MATAISNKFVNLFRVSVAALLLLLFVSFSAACQNDKSDEERPAVTVLGFTTGVHQLERQRDEIIEDYQFVTANLNNMGTQEVFDRADQMVDDLGALRERLTEMTGPPTTAPTKTLFLNAYDAELKGYQSFAEEVRRGFTDVNRIREIVGQFLVS